MYEQLNIFDVIEDSREYKYCSGCINAKYKERTRNGIDIYFCNNTRSVITPSTQDWLCRKKHGESLYERR